MKKSIILIFLFASLTCFADKKTPAMKAKEKTDELQLLLNLSTEQNKKIYDINLKAYTSIEDYEKKKPSKKLRKKQKEIVQDLRKLEYKKIMTTDQFKKYEAHKKLEKENEKKEKAALEKLKPTNK